MQKISFIGAGNMASSLIGGMIQDGFNAADITAFDVNEQALVKVKSEFSINVSENLKTALQNADVVVLAVKPQVLQSVCRQIESFSIQPPLYVSVAAGIRIDSIDEWLGGQQAVIRTMPNTPALLGCGATALFANAAVDDDQKQLAEKLMSAVGMTVWVNAESALDTVTALSGSGPAYFFLMIDAMKAAAVDLGLDEVTAAKLAAQTALGAASMARQNLDFSQLRKNVTSKGGTTEHALNSFEKDQFSKIVAKAMLAARQRSEALAVELAQSN